MVCPEIASSMTLNNYLAALSAPVRLSDVTDLLAIGLSLYLALGIVQVASSVGISSLRRKAETYRLYVVQNRKTDRYSKARDLLWEVHSAEIDADGVNKAVLWAVCVCLLLALPYFVWSILAGELWITGRQVGFLALGYVGVPVFLFVGGLIAVRRKSAAVREAVKQAFREI